MPDQHHPATVQQITGQVRSMCYLVDEPTTTLTIHTDGQTIAARAPGQIAMDLRALPRGATICATIHDAQRDRAQIVDFHIRACDR